MSQLDFIKTPKVDNVKLDDHTSGVRGSVEGTLHLTTTHLIFVDPNGAKETWILYSHIAEVEKLPTTARRSSIRIKTKIFRNVTFNILREKECSVVYETILQLSNPTNYEDLYAFHYNPKESELTQVAGWALYDANVEFGRQGVPAHLWKKTKLNTNYKLCETYPSTIYVPASVNNNIITSCANFRSKNRLPVLSYYNKSTQTSICRCAQPMSGFNTRCSEDEQMLQAIITSTPNTTKMYIVDTRPKINAMANRAAGKGYENMSHYDNIDFQFIGIENIHVMRQSLQKLLEIFDVSNLSMSAYLKGLEDSGWLKHIKSVMDTSWFIAKAIAFEKRSVLVHCSDGWDRTAQTCSLAAILLDPYYRTIHGFQTLVEKEWLSFGHKFVHRCGLLSHDPKEISPIFTQYLESVWQLMNQFPTAFQFNERLLLEINTHVYSCQFGTFLGNCEKERKDLRLSGRTYSLWGHMWQNLPDYVNPFFIDGAHSTLKPSTTPSSFKFWRSLYNRYNDKVHPRLSPADYVCSLNDHNDSLVDHIKYLEKAISSFTVETKVPAIGASYSTDVVDNSPPIVKASEKEENEDEQPNYDESIQLLAIENNDISSIKNNGNKEITVSENNKDMAMLLIKNNGDKEIAVIENNEQMTMPTIKNNGDKKMSEIRNNKVEDSLGEPVSISGTKVGTINETAVLPQHSRGITSFALEWKSFRDVRQCSCGKPIDVLSRKYHCWNCGEVFCTSCVDLSSVLPGHYSGNKVPVCKQCFKKLRK